MGQRGGQHAISHFSYCSLLWEIRPILGKSPGWVSENLDSILVASHLAPTSPL